MFSCESWVIGYLILKMFMDQEALGITFHFLLQDKGLNDNADYPKIFIRK